MTDHASRRRRGPVIRAVAAVVGAVLALVLPAMPAAAHDQTTSAAVSITRDGSEVAVELELEYDLLMKSAWTYAEAYEATGRGEQLRQLAENAEAVDVYVTERFAVEVAEEQCVPQRSDAADIRLRDDRAFAVLRFAYDCAGHEDGTITVSSALFPDAEGFVHGTETLVHWELDGARGNGLLDARSPTLELGDGAPQLGEFFLLGVEHLLLGLDHLLFLLALILGARSIRGLVITATTFTVAHSVTFLLAAMGFVNLPAVVVEPVIALSIVAAAAAALPRRESAARLRMPVVFAFGLLHGLGFASALGVDDEWSWELLWSLVAFNLGIEAVQLAIIAAAFPLLLLLRRTTAADPATRVTGILVGAVGLFWFAERLVAAF